MVINKTGSFPADKMLLSDIQKLSFIDEKFSVETVNGAKVYAFDDIAKLLFKDNSSVGIQNRQAKNDLDVFVYVNPAGDAIVKSFVAIKSATLFGIDGKMISKQSCFNTETQCTTSLQGKTAGVYLIRVETTQGVVVKKLSNY